MKKALSRSLVSMAAAAAIFAPASALQADNVKSFVLRLKGGDGGASATGSSGRSPSSSYRNDSDSDFAPREGGVVVSPNERRDGGRAYAEAAEPIQGGGSGGSAATVTTRSLRFSNSADVPKSLRSAASQDKIDLRRSSGGVTSVSYHVDSASRISREDILFRKGSTEFADRYSLRIVRDLAFAMQDPELRGMQFVIEGHASSDGSYQGNLHLSQRRAERIVHEMIRLGVEPHQLVAVGYGESEARHPDYAPEYLLANDRKVVVYRLDG